ncbi:MAG: hypothetical protein BGO63_03270 [Candidatus Accumulibacter sp. 66-26]|nr:hypothetical protein [Accumulibacter sp.]OJW48205.1 MAG: hypothetical protein BGO63_03270 [Candidatus Accumulibacter sp. 66-26]
MSTNPQRTLALVAEYYGLLSDLASQGDSVSLGDLRSLLQKHHPEGERAPEKVAELLEQFGLFEKAADSDNSWEVPYVVGEFLRHLSMRQRLSAPGLLGPIIEEVARLTEDLRMAFEASDIDRVRQASNSIKQALDAARGLSRGNSQSIVNEVMRIKTREDHRSLRERYLFITYLHEKHLTPLGALVEVGGEMERRASELIAVAKLGCNSMPDDPFVPELTSKVIAGVRRLKDDAWSDFHSSLREVTPLFRQIRRDHAMAVAISRQLDRVGREGAKGLDKVVDQLPIARWRPDNVFSTYALEEYLSGVANYVANPDPGPLATLSDSVAPPVLDPDEVVESLLAAGEQKDLLAWIVGTFSAYPDQQLLQAFHNISGSPGFQCAFGDQPVQAETETAIYTYLPTHISANA